MEAKHRQDLSRLYDLGFGWFGSKDRQIAILERLQLARGPEITPWLLPGAFSKDRRLAQVIRETISHLLQFVPPAELVRLESKLGPRYPEVGLCNQSYLKLKPSMLESAKLGTDHHLLGLLTFHPNGHMREVACRLLDSEGLRYLLLRLNDWVPQVRDAAKQRLARLMGKNPQAWVACMPLLHRLRDCGRADHSEFIHGAEDSLRSPLAKDAVLQGLQSPDRVTRRRCFELALSHLRAAELMARALQNADGMVRVWAVKRGPEVLEGEALEEFLEQAFLNKVPSVRRLALAHWKEEQPESTEPLVRALLDSNRSLREWAQYYCRELDREAIYKEKLRDNPWAVVGLAEVGCKEEEPALALLEHEDWRFQRAALLALTTLKAEESLFFPALESQNLSLSKTAVFCLERLKPDLERLHELYQNSEWSHVRLYAFRLYLRGCSAWDRTLALAEGVLSADEIIQEKSLSLFKTEVGQSPPSYAPPPKVQAALKQMWDQLAPYLSPEEQERFHRCFV